VMLMMIMMMMVAMMIWRTVETNDHTLCVGSDCGNDLWSLQRVGVGLKS
jgi:hypothetical protein